MEIEALKELISEVRNLKSERQNVELKSCLGGFPKRIYDSLSSFSNQDGGGIIIFGVNDKPHFDICGVYDVEAVQKRIMENCKQMVPSVRALITVCEIEGKFIVAAEIPGVEFSSRPVYYAGLGRLKGSFIRVGDGDEPMSEYEIYSYEAFRRRIHDDLRTVERAKLENLNPERIEQYLELTKREKKNLLNNVSDSEILELMGITQSGLPTLSGILVFSDYPQAFFPQLSITAVSVPGTEIGELGDDGERFIDNVRIQGPISIMLEEATSFVRKNSRTKTIVTTEGRREDKTEYPITAVREAILNALVHRDYSIHTENTPISIEMYRDRIEIKNSGGLYGNFTVDNLGKGRPDTRNPILANILEVMKVTENRYSGIPTIYREFEKVGLPKPEFEVVRGEFTVIFRNNLQDEGAKTKEGPKYDKNQDLVQAILEYCEQPRSRDEIIAFTGKSRYYTMSTLVLPLVREGGLKMSMPDKPKSKEQRYSTVKQENK